MTPLQAYLWMMATLWGYNAWKVAREHPLPIWWVLAFALMTAWSLVLSW